MHTIIQDKFEQESFDFGKMAQYPQAKILEVLFQKRYKQADEFLLDVG